MNLTWRDTLRLCQVGVAAILLGGNGTKCRRHHRGSLHDVFTAPVLIGIGLAPVIVVLGRLSGLDRDRAMYPITLIVIAAYYVRSRPWGEPGHCRPS